MVTVIVREGILEGEVVKNEFGGQFCSFKGIPYAEPPVGNLRFKAPQPKSQWNGVRSAKQYGPVSVQIDPIISPNPIGSEDCLYLNVYTPELKPSKPLPVMVWIHGGGFRSGSGNDDLYGPEFLIRHGVIIVTINYRLGALGFLSLDTEEIPGNAGMKDQVLALRWVKNNIKSFGGDPNNVTIFGESAGGASVSYHLVSPMSKGLFKRAIVQSGTLTCSWAQMYKPREGTLKLAKQLGCNSEDDKELVNFFMNVPSEKFFGLDLSDRQSTEISEISFSICDEKKFGNNERFFYGDQAEVLKNGIHKGVEVMTGYTEDEGLISFAFEISLDNYISKANELREFFVPKTILLNCTINEQLLKVSRKIKEFYFKNDVVSKEKFDQLLTFLNWDMFVHGSQLFFKLISSQTNVYTYKLTCKSERNAFAHLFTGISEVVGNKQVVCHGDDLLYLFPFKIGNLKLDQASHTFTYIDRMTTLWTNFAKFGNPTPDEKLGVKWPPFTLDKKEYLDIGNELVVRTNPDAADEAFWDSIFKEYLPSYTA